MYIFDYKTNKVIYIVKKWIDFFDVLNFFIDDKDKDEFFKFDKIELYFLIKYK